MTPVWRYHIAGLILALSCGALVIVRGYALSGVIILIGACLAVMVQAVHAEFGR